MASLFECFAPTFARGLALDAEAGAPAALDQVRAELVGLLAQARARAATAQKPTTDIERAAFAVVAWLDEVLARRADALGGWTPLQVELFQTNNAGNEFFAHLRDLRPDQAEVREVYYTALCLGFVGEHVFDPAQLEQIKQATAQALPVPPRPIAALASEPITPQPYQAPLPRGRRLPRHWEKPVLALATALAVLVPLGLFGYFAWQTPGPPPPSPQPQPLPPGPPSPSPQPAPDVRVEVERIVHQFRCAELGFEVNPDQRVSLKGFVASEADLATLRDRVAAAPGVSGVIGDQVEVYPRPFCEVLLITAPLRERNARDNLGLAVDVPGGTVLREGDDLVLEIGTPRFDAYLYLDYVQHDGVIGHVAHAPADEPPDGASQRFRYPTNYQIEAPFGREMIVITASKQPIFQNRRPEFEPAEDYLPALKRRVDELLAADPQLPMAASYVFIRTESRNPP